MEGIKGNVQSAADNVREAKKLTGSVAKSLGSFNDPRLAALKLNVDTLDAKLTAAVSELDIANGQIVKKDIEVAKITKERNSFQRAAINERVVTKYVMFVIAFLSVGFFSAGQILIKIYASQVTAFLPLVGNLASDILSYIAGFIAFAVFLLLMLLLQSPLMWIVQAIIWWIA